MQGLHFFYKPKILLNEEKQLETKPWGTITKTQEEKQNKNKNKTIMKIMQGLHFKILFFYQNQS